MEEIFDVVVIGGGQSALACGYYLRRAKLNFLILDKQDVPGGAWLHAWDSLTLFSPADYSSLPGWLIPMSEHRFPLRQEVVDYLAKYEEHYQLNVKRGIEVIDIKKEEGHFTVFTQQNSIRSKAIISATGTWGNPIIPHLEGAEDFQGTQIHSRNYKKPVDFINKKTLVIGEGNSGAQIVAEVSKVTDTKWSTRSEPQFLPDDVDGYYLFNVASAKYKAEKEGKPFDSSKYNLGNIVMVPPVKEARERGVLVSGGTFHQLYTKGVIWDTGEHEEFDALIWCTGFGYDTSYLKKLIHTDEKGIPKTIESRSLEIDGLWFVGYGNWSGYASATLIGVNRSAKQTVLEIEEFINKNQ
ncbi:putative flavoprotein involved in K+ transport [Chryseobacterium sp. H1D6B]|uniref:ArsO family NAD(P)H-dependent flavin-containing monooxygenase n=1 Tax=Chryseobacterium sp. H1D6B TaxID=2940588 RepID=UPI0015CE1290|nr:ArsO family NAD(P)H-dependent flavin-containing monooxygenase [Chryseobacterium sp. H1D6B]MDH6252331.1 putative flavoprotein involved in K+ transport [Chryseobacterium sp. H1D6B]